MRETQVSKMLVAIRLVDFRFVRNTHNCFFPSDDPTRASPDLDMTVEVKEEGIAATSSASSDGKNRYPLVSGAQSSWSMNEGRGVHYGILTECFPVPRVGTQVSPPRRQG